MAYKLYRSKRVVEELELCDAEGKVLHTIGVDFDVDAMARDFNARYNAIIAAELAIKKLGQSPEEQGKAAELYGNAVIALFNLIFGEENTAVILGFYENRYSEMTLEVFPFILEVIVPAVGAAVREKSRKAAEMHKALKK